MGEGVGAQSGNVAIPHWMEFNMDVKINKTIPKMRARQGCNSDCMNSRSHQTHRWSKYPKRKIIGKGWGCIGMEGMKWCNRWMDGDKLKGTTRSHLDHTISPEHPNTPKHAHVPQSKPHRVFSA